MVGDADLKNASRDERDDLAAPTAHFIALDQSGGAANATGVDQAKGGKKSKRKA